MSIFSSKEVTHLDTVTVPLFEEDDLPNVVKDSYSRALAFNVDYTDSLLAGIKNAFYHKVRRVYQEAKAGNYHYGTPDMKHFAKTVGNTEVEAVLKSLFGAGIQLQYLDYGTLHPVLYGWHKLYSEFGYLDAANTIDRYSQQVGHTCYLDDMVANYSIVDVLLQRLWFNEDTRYNGPSPKKGTHPKRPFGLAEGIKLTDPTFDAGKGLGVTIKYVYVDGDGNFQRGEEFLSMAAFEGKDYFQAAFLDTAGNPAVWFYEDGAGTYPTLDVLTDAEYTTPGDYFPFFVFRAWDTNRASDSLKNTAAYKTSSKMLEFMDMSFAEIGKTIHENPDIDKVEQAVMTMAVPGTATSQAELEYLFKFFARLSSTEHTYATNTGSWSQLYGTPNEIIWKDADFEMRLNFHKIEQRLVGGKVGAPGSYGLKQRTATGTYTYSRSRYDHSTEGWVSEQYTRSYEYPVLTYQFQETASVVREISVHGPMMKYPVSDSGNTQFWGNNDLFLIPVDMTLAEDMAWDKQQELYHRSMRFIFNSKVVEKIKWYQRGVFKKLLVVIGVVLFFTGIGAPIGATIIAAVQAGAYLAASILVFSIVATAWALSVAFRWIVKELGLQNTLIAAIVMVAVAALTGITDFGLLYFSAETLLMYSNGLMHASMAELANQFVKYQSEKEAFELYAQEKYDELDKLYEAVGLEGLPDPFENNWLLPVLIPGEEPTDFYNRTIHAGNIGVAPFEQIKTYVTDSLKLPGIESDHRIEVNVYG